MEGKEKKFYTIDDVARELGVSKSTVSRAISGKGRIGSETRERVLRFIEEHDYRPNAVAKGLAQKKTYNLGLILPLDYAATEFSFFKDCMNESVRRLPGGIMILLFLLWRARICLR